MNGPGAERDEGHAVHYTAVEPGTTIYASDDVEVGTVVRVLDNYREHILDGIVFRDSAGTTRFVDGPEVQRTFERAVYLNIPASEARALGPPPHGRASDALRRSRLGRLLGR